MQGVPYRRRVREFPPPLQEEDVVIAAPPPVRQSTRSGLQWLQVVIPAVGSAGSLAFVFIYRFSPVMLVVAGLMIALSVGSGVLLRFQQTRTQSSMRKGEQREYLRYLEENRSLVLAENARMQLERAKFLSPAPSELEALALKRERVWERRRDDADFLRVRVGVGPGPALPRLRLESAASPFQQFDPALLARAQAVFSRFDQIEGLPIDIALKQQGLVSIVGKRAEARAALRGMLCQVAALHAPSDVRIVAYYSPEARDEWDWLKWLPHTRRLRPFKTHADQAAEMEIKVKAGEQLCLLADDAATFRTIYEQQIKPVLEHLRKLRERDSASHAPADNQTQPHMLVVLDGYDAGGPLGQLTETDELLRSAGELDTTVICLVDDLSHEPSATRARIALSDGGWLRYVETAERGARHVAAVLPDRPDLVLCSRLARALAPLMLSEQAAQGDLTRNIHLLDLLRTFLKLPPTEPVAPERVWRARKPDQLLRTPLGEGAKGAPLILDLKELNEGGMGPHGMIIGATGSGKGELIRTIITGLALTHDPETLNFVLVDYKGGATFAKFEALPHLAGMITNLESNDALIDRALASLRGEFARRQQMLSETGRLDDIRAYQLKRQSDPTLEPMPYLLIVIDEFAELLAQESEFMSFFQLLGQQGRSLGMHLLFITQKLDEGRIANLIDHLRYRVCLLTFTAAESTAVLGAPDAYYLPPISGMGYFKVGTNTYDLFKGAMVTNLAQTNSASELPAVTIRSFSSLGRLEAPYPQPVSASASGGLVASITLATTLATAVADTQAPRTDMEVATARVAEAWHGAKVHTVWLPPLPARVTLGEVFRRSGRADLDGRAWPTQPPFGALRAPVGLTDLPDIQRQEPVMLDFSGAGGHLALVGASHSGKSSLLRTLMVSLMLTHTPRDVQFYCLDFGGGLLSTLEGAPHVGDVCGRRDREKVFRLVRQIRSILDERALFFQQQGIETMASYRARRQAGEYADLPYGDVFLVIDDFGQLRSEFDALQDDIADILAMGLAYGVHVVTSASRWGDMRAAVLDHIGARLELRLHEPGESQVDRAAKAIVARLPGDTPGRGVTRSGREYQTAIPVLADMVVGAKEQLDGVVQRSVAAIVQALGAAWRLPRAPEIKMLPGRVVPADLPPLTGAAPAGARIGLDEFELEPVFLDLFTTGPHFLVYGDSKSGKTNFLRAYLQSMMERYSPDEAQFIIVDYRRQLLTYVDTPYTFGFAYNAASAADCVNRLMPRLQDRLPTSSQLTGSELMNLGKWAGPQYIVLVDDYDVVCTSLDSGFGQPENPLKSLINPLRQGGDAGLHVVLAQAVGGASGNMDAMRRRLKDMNSPGLILSGSPLEGPLIGAQKAAMAPPGRGYLVRPRERTTLIQTVYVGA